MQKSSRLRSKLFVFGFCTLAARPAHAQISLDKLTACNDIERVYTALKAEPTIQPSDCRPPRDGLESVLASRAGANASRFCFLRISPAPFLNSFSCVRFNYETPTGTTDVTCFRAASMDDIRVYKEQYAERFAAIESRYLAAAQKCAVSNGDSSVAASTTFPPMLAVLARFQLGFLTALGAQRPSDSSIFHGYGQTDPSIGPRVPSGIEVVSVLVNSPIVRSAPANRRTVREWIVDVDDLATPERVTNEQFARTNAAMRFNMISYALTREDSHGMTLRAKLPLISALHDSIAQDLLTKGFDEFSEAEMKRETGKSKEELLRDITKNMPFGNRDQGLFAVSPSFRMLFNETGLPCTRNGMGAVAAFLMGFQPKEGVQRDFGSVFVVVARVGACSASGDARTYARSLLDDATREIIDALGRR